MSEPTSTATVACLPFAFRAESPRVILSLAAIPLLLVVTTVWLYRAFGSFDTDPDYAYLLNALSVLQLHPPDLYVHPGTTIEVLGAIIVGLIGGARALFSGQPIHSDLLLHPEIYLFAIDLTVIVTSAWVWFFFGRALHRATGSLFIAFVGQATVFVSKITLIGLVKMAPESFLLLATMLLATLSVPLIFTNRPIERRHLLRFGAVVGLCLATKADTLPLLLTVFYLKTWRQRFMALAACLGSFVFFTLPIIKQYFHIFRIYTSFATHTGSYGSGPEGFPSAAQLLQNLHSLFNAAPDMFIDLAICAVALVVIAIRRRSLPPVGTRFFAVSGTILLFQVVLVSRSPGVHYLLPAIATCCLVNAAAVQLVLPARLLTACAISALLLGWGTEVVAARDLARARVEERAADQTLLNSIASAGCTIIYYHNAPVTAYKLEFGNEWAGLKFGPELRSLYPRDFFYDFGGRDLEKFGLVIGGADEQQSLGDARCIYFVGSAIEAFGPSYLPMASLELIGQAKPGDAGSLSVYQLKRDASGAWPRLSRWP